MSADSPQSPRDLLEARLTAMLLEELSAEESAALQAEITQSPELSALHAELVRAIGLVGQAAGSLQEETTAPVEGLKLSSARREKLLASFKVLRPAALVPQPRFKWREVATLAAMLVLLLVLAGGMGLEVMLEKERRLVTALKDDERDSFAVASVREDKLEQRFGALALTNFGEVRNALSVSDLSVQESGKRGTEHPQELAAKLYASKPEPPSQPVGEINGRADSPVVALGLGGGRGSAPVSGEAMQDAYAYKRKELNDSLAGPGGAPPAPAAPQPQPAPESRFFAGKQAAADRNRFAVELGRTAGGLSGGSAVTAPSSAPLHAAASEVNAPRPAAAGNPSASAIPPIVANLDGATDVPALKQSVTALGEEDDDKLTPRAPRPPMPNAAVSKRMKLANQELGLEFKTRSLLRPSVVAGVKLTALPDHVDDLSVAVGQDKKEEKLAEIEQVPARSLSVAAPIPQPERSTAESAFSTFSLNVTDVSFKLAAASLEKGQMPDPSTVRSEEFINAFDYRDPEPSGRAPVAFTWERARDPFEHDRDLLRFSVKTAASGRQSGRPLNLVLLLDNSGSMERADRVQIRQECLRILAAQLQPQDHISVVAFARTARLWLDNLPGTQAAELPQRVGGLTPEGGTNLEEAMNLAYQTAQRHFLPDGVNRVVLLTDGAANLGDVKPESLKRKVEANRSQGIALDCFGIGWEGFNDELMEALARNGDGRYGFVNTPEAASTEFASQLVGALKVAASDVKVQVEWNPRRVTAYRQVGYARHQLTKEQFRDNSVDAAELGAAEAGNAIYTVQVNPAGEGPLGTVRVRFKVPGTSDYQEHEWPLAYDGGARALDSSSPALRLAVTASAFSEWLVGSPFAGEVTPDKLLGYLRGVPENWPSDPRPKKLEWMIRQAGGMAAK